MLLILPAVFYAGLQKYKDSLGEYYLGRNCDPSYAYLINSLNLCQFKGYGVGLISHPGTPVQEIGAAVLLITHSMKSGSKDIVTDVFDNPEYYLNNICNVFLFLISSAIFLLGLTAYVKMKSIFPALFFQLTPFSFYSEDIYFQLTNVSVEPVLVFTVLLLIASIIMYLYKKDNEKSNLIFAVVFGILCGLGMATKISFLPVMIIPFLLLKKFRLKGLFILASVISFFILIYPAFSSHNANEFVVWVKDLITHSGKYGTGSEDLVETTSYFNNIRTVFSKNLIFSITYILLFILCMLQFTGKYKDVIRSDKYYNLLTGIFLAMTIQILIVAKHFSLYYMIPVYMFSIPGLFALNSAVLSMYPDLLNTKNRKYIFYSATVVLIIVYSVFQIRIINKDRKQNAIARNEERKIISALEGEFKNSTIISSYECSSREFALFLGSSYGGTRQKDYMTVVRNRYPDNIYFNRWNNTLYKEWENDNIKEKLLKENKFIFQGVSDEVALKFMEYVRRFTDKPNAVYRKVMSGIDRDGVYEITLDPGRQ